MNIDEALAVLCHGKPEQREKAIQKVNQIAMPLFAEKLAQEGETDHNVTQAMFRKGFAQFLLLNEKRPKEKGIKQSCKTESLLNICLGQWIIRANTVASRLYFSKLIDQGRGFLYSKFRGKSGIEDYLQEAGLAFMYNLKIGKYRGGSKPGGYFNTIARNISLKNLNRDPYTSLEIDIEDDNPHLKETQLRDDALEQWLMTQVDKLKTNCKDILVDWANKKSTKDMMKKYNYASESVVFVRINACKQNLRKALFASLGIKCKKLLLAFYAQKKKPFYPAFYTDLAKSHGYDSEHEYIQQIDRCLRGLSDNLIK